MSASSPSLTAPFPYFGGKRRVAEMVWERLGANVDNYVEPFFGSGAVLLARPGFDPSDPPVETINDADCFVANFWRAVKAVPQEVAALCDWPVNEADLESRHKWLVTASRKAGLERSCKDDPDYYDAQVAAWWCWGLSCWIGSGWCAGEWHGPGDGRNRGSGINTIGADSGQRTADSGQRTARGGGTRPELYSRHGIFVRQAAGSHTSPASRESGKSGGHADPRRHGEPRGVAKATAPTHTHTHTHTHKSGGKMPDVFGDRGIHAGRDRSRRGF
ncbi:MAG: DNA adenine methylase [Phycisphaerales bacterium]|nr:DNA adenine methylase [Phycisphaerales bacterium]